MTLQVETSLKELLETNDELRAEFIEYVKEAFANPFVVRENGIGLFPDFSETMDEYVTIEFEWGEVMNELFGTVQSDNEGDRREQNELAENFRTFVNQWVDNLTS